jgi:AcrR family transcriptional regulator
MSHTETTRDHIVRCAAAVFNQGGYAASSVSDLERATGLRTGGIYRYFASKEELGLAAFDYAVGRLDAQFDEAARAPLPAVDRLKAILQVYARLATDPPVPGGCPVMNAAIETDTGGSEALRLRTRQAMARWRRRIEQVAREGQQRGEIRPDVEAGPLADFFLATMEGAVMLAGLSGDGESARAAAGHLLEYLEARVRA